MLQERLLFAATAPPPRVASADKAADCRRGSARRRRPGRRARPPGPPLRRRRPGEGTRGLALAVVGPPAREATEADLRALAARQPRDAVQMTATDALRYIGAEAK